MLKSKKKKTGEELLHFWILREIRLKGITFFEAVEEGPGRGGWVPLISSDKDDRMVAKFKTQKNPWAKTPKKIPCRISEPYKSPEELRGQDTWKLSCIFRLF